MTRRDWLGLTGFIVACAVISALGGAVTATSVDGWYQTLNKPPFNPPDWVFAPVWTTVFALIAVAGWRIWRRRNTAGAPLTLGLYALQLLLNLLWSVLFFGLQAPTAALVEIIVLLTVLVAILRLSARIDGLATMLWLPYPLWVAFAAVLNAAIVALN